MWHIMSLHDGQNCHSCMHAAEINTFLGSGWLENNFKFTSLEWAVDEWDRDSEIRAEIRSQLLCTDWGKPISLFVYVVDPVMHEKGATIDWEKKTCLKKKERTMYRIWGQVPSTDLAEYLYYTHPTTACFQCGLLKNDPYTCTVNDWRKW